MPEEHPRRRLAAILAVDVVGYSRLMEQDEAGTLAAAVGRFRATCRSWLIHADFGRPGFAQHSCRHIC
jgi:class 3 adenylate cyclase